VTYLSQTSCTPSKYFEKFGHKNSDNPNTPSKEFENDCATWYEDDWMKYKLVG
jgi:hypothetical protein